MTRQELDALRERRTRLVAEARTLHDSAKPDQPLTSEQHEKVERLLADAAEVGRTLAREEKIDAEERVTLPDTARDDAADDEAARLRTEQPEVAEERERYSRAMNRYLRDGLQMLEPDDLKVLRSGYQQFSADERRAMSTLTAAGGGYTVFPDMSFATRIIEALKYFGGVEQAGAEVITTDGGGDLPFLTDDDTANTGAIVGEGGSQDGGTDVALGQKVLRAHLYTTKVVKVSWQLLQDAAINLEAYLGQKFGVRLGRIQNTHYTTGTAVAQPEGVIVGATVGRQAATGNTTSIPADDIKRLFYSVDIAYRNMNSVFMMNDATALILALLKDGQGRYLWQDAIADGSPPRLVGKPVVFNNDMASAAASAKTIAFGAFEHYKIRRVRAMTVLRLNERYADTGQVGFLAYMRADGGLVDAGQNPVKVFQQSAT